MYLWTRLFVAVILMHSIAGLVLLSIITPHLNFHDFFSPVLDSSSWWTLLASGTCFSVGIHNFALNVRAQGEKCLHLLLPGYADGTLKMLSTALIQPSGQESSTFQSETQLLWFLEMHINRHYMPPRWACGQEPCYLDPAQPDKPLHWQEAGQTRAGAWRQQVSSNGLLCPYLLLVAGFT